MPDRSPDLLLPLLASRSPVTLEQLQQALGQASRATTFRYLRQVPYLRSYNHNGRFYTSRDPGSFDALGLLSIGDVHFSRDGSLRATIERLLATSEEGFSDPQLRALLHVPVQPFLLAAVRQGRARRERLDGVFVYFAPGDHGKRQLRARRDRLAEHLAAGPDTAPGYDVIIAVLLVLVRCPGLTPQQTARRLQSHSPPIPLAQVRAVFDRFDLAAAIQKGGPTSR